jgi:hypothetical protein
MQPCKIQDPEPTPTTFATVSNQRQQAMETITHTPTHLDQVKDRLNKEFIRTGKST